MLQFQRIYIMLTVFGLPLLSTACQEGGTALEPDHASIELLVDIAGGKAPGGGLARFKNLEDATALVVSIEDASGALVYDSERVELYDFDGAYLSHPLSLLPGSYALTELLVVDASGSVLYATPLEGSDMAYLVQDPLEISFGASKDAVTTVRPEVLSTAEHAPEDFGYASFGVDVVDVIDFLVAVFIYDDASQALVSATADIEVTNEAGEMLYTGSLAALTNEITVQDGHAQYELTITKPGYARYSQTFTGAELAAYFDSATGGPIEVVLAEQAYLASCKAVLDAGQSTGGGVYTIDPDGAGPDEPFQTWCDMETAGGGWTLVGALSNNDADQWSSDAAWSTAVPFGSVTNIGQGDYKSTAFGRLQATDLLITVKPRNAIDPLDHGAGVWRHTADAFAGLGNLMNLYNSLSWPTGVCFGGIWSCTAYRAPLTASGSQGDIAQGGQWGFSMRNFDLDDANGGAVMAPHYADDYLGSLRVCNFGGGYRNGTWGGPDVGNGGFPYSNSAGGAFCTHLHGSTAQVLLWER